MLDPGVPHQRADPNAIGMVLDVRVAIEPVDVDQDGGTGEAHVQRRHEALAAGEQLCVCPVAREELVHVRERLRANVGERGGFHGASGLRSGADARAYLMQRLH